MIWSFWAPKGQRRNPWVKALKSLEGIVFLSPSLTSPRAMQIGLNASTRPHLSEMWSGLWNLQPTAAVQSHYICEIKNILNFFSLPPRGLALIFFSPTMCFQFSCCLAFVNFLSDVLHSSGYPLLFPLPANCLKGIIRKILPCTRPHVRFPSLFFHKKKRCFAESPRCLFPFNKSRQQTVAVKLHSAL